jgi:hypothetical protein
MGSNNKTAATKSLVDALGIVATAVPPGLPALICEAHRGGLRLDRLLVRGRARRWPGAYAAAARPGEGGRSHCEKRGRLGITGRRVVANAQDLMRLLPGRHNGADRFFAEHGPASR